jgi:hypothetical protein
MQNDWKLLTLWIGANDLCAACEENTVRALTTCVSVIFGFHFLETIILFISP